MTLLFIIFSLQEMSLTKKYGGGGGGGGAKSIQLFVCNTFFFHGIKRNNGYFPICHLLTLMAFMFMFILITSDLLRVIQLLPVMILLYLLIATFSPLRKMIGFTQDLDCPTHGPWVT